MEVAVSLFLGGLVAFGCLYLWLRERPQAAAKAAPDAIPHDIALASGDNPVLVAREHGQLVYANDAARRWLQLALPQGRSADGDLNLEAIARQTQPVESFLALFAGETRSTFQFGRRWVEATSRRIPAVGETRTVVTLRELSSAPALDSLNPALALAVLDEIGETVNAGQGVEQVLQSLLTIIRKSISADAGEICLWDEATRTLHPRGWVGDVAYVLALAEAGGVYYEDEGISGWIARHRQPVLVTDVAADDAVRPKLADQPYRSFAAVPLAHGERFVGTLELASAKTRAFDRSTLALLQAISKQAAASIVNAELYIEQMRRVQDIATVQALPAAQAENTGAVYLTLGERIARLLSAEMCGVLVYDEGKAALVAEPPFYGLPSQLTSGFVIPLFLDSAAKDIFENRDYWFSNDLADEPLADELRLSLFANAAGMSNAILMPMEIGGRRTGMILVGEKKAHGGFTPADAQNLRLLSAQAAVIVENLRLHGTEARVDAELAGLQEITRAIGALRDEDEFYSDITARIAGLMDIAICGVLLYDEASRRLASRLPFYGVPDEQAADYSIELRPNSAFTQIWENEPSWYSNRVATDPVIFQSGMADFAEVTDISKTLFAVLSAAGQRIGVVQAANKRSGEDFTDRDARLLLFFATQAAAMIANARLYREAQRRADEAEGARRVAELAGAVLSADDSFAPVLAEICRLTDSPAAFVSTLSPDGDALITEPRRVYGVELSAPIVSSGYGSGARESVAVSRRALTSAKLRNDAGVAQGYRSLAASLGVTGVLITPLAVGERPLGELAVANRTRPYDADDARLLAALAVQLAGALERLRLSVTTGQNVSRRMLELDAIARVSSELNVTLDLDAILTLIHDEALKVTEAAGCAIVLLRPRPEWRSADAPEVERRLGSGDAAALAPVEKEAVTRAREPVLVDDYARESLTPTPATARSAAAAAIIYDDTPVGVIHLYHDAPQHFDTQAATFLTALAAKASLAYASARSYAENAERSARLRRRVEQLSTIFELGQMLHTSTDAVMLLEAFAYSIQQSAGFDIVVMTLVDEETKTLRRAAQAGLPLEVFEKHRSVTLPLSSLDKLFADEYRVGESFFLPFDSVSKWYTEGAEIFNTTFTGKRSLYPRSKDDWRDGDMLLVPMLGAGGNLLGVMSVDRPFDNRRPDRSSVEILEMFAHQAASTMENVRLYSESLHSAEQEARLNEVMEAISSTLDVNQIVETVARGALRLLPFTRMTVALLDADQSGFDILHIAVKPNSTLATSTDRRASLDRTALGRTFETRQDFLYHASDDDIQAYQDMRAWHHNGERTSLIVPLLAGGQCLGAMHFGSDLQDAYGFKEYRALFKRIANLAAVVIQNARLFNQAVNLRLFNESIVASIQQGIVVLDRSGLVVSINAYMRDHFGWDDAALRADLFAYRPNLAFLADDARAVLDTGTPRERINVRLEGESGAAVLNFYLYPLRAADSIRGAVLLTEDVAERARLERDLQARAERLSLLNRVSVSLAQSLDTENILEIGLREIAQMLGIGRGRALLIERDMRVGRVVVEFPRGDTPPSGAMDIGRSATLTAIDRDVQPIVLTEVATLPDGDPLRDELQARGVAAYLAIPMAMGGKAIGAFELEAPDAPRPFEPEQIDLSLTIANQTAIAVQNANLLEQTLVRTRELETLLEAAQSTSFTLDLDELFQSVARLTLQALDMDDCVITLYFPVEDELEVQIDMNRYGARENVAAPGARYPVEGYPARRRALDERQVVIIRRDDPDADPREVEELAQSGSTARMLVPLVVRDQSTGLIQIELQSRFRTFTHRDVRMAQALGAQAASAIDNARLSTETAARVEELLVINDLSRAISSTMDINKMIHIVREQVPNLTNAEQLYLALYDSERTEISFPMVIRDGADAELPPRKLSNDEVSFVIRHRRLLSLGGDFSLDEMRRNLGIVPGEGDVTAYLGVPLIAGDQVLGVLAVCNRQRAKAFGLNDQRILTTIGTQLGAAIQNARLYSQIRSFAEDLNRRVQERTLELQQERDRLDALYRITSELSRTLDIDRVLNSALQMVVGAVSADNAVILLLDSDTGKLYHRASYLQASQTNGRGEQWMEGAEVLGSWLINNIGAIVIDDLHAMEFWDGTQPGAADWRGALAVLLETNEDVKGVMVCFSRRTGIFTEPHLRLVSAAASQVATAINNADLYKLIRDQADRLGALLRTEQEEAEKSAAILESVADGVMLADAEGTIILFNNAAERIFNIAREKILGQPFTRLSGMLRSDARNWLFAIGEWTGILDAAKTREMLVEQFEIGDKIVNAQLSPVYIGDQLLGTVSVFRDITRDVEVDRMKTEFISNVSHELRTPMTSIKGYADLLLMGATGAITDQQRQFITTIKSNADRLASLVNDLLNISRLDSGRERLNLDSVDIGALLTSVSAHLAGRNEQEKKAIQVKVEVESGLPALRADRNKIIQVLTNIADNAFNYTYEGGSITLQAGLRQDKDHVLVSVRDTGIGIPADYQSRIWDRFERFEQHALVMEVAGTGLGLPIARSLVQMHHGDIWFESEVGKGTTFFISLPIRQPELEDDDTLTLADEAEKGG